MPKVKKYNERQMIALLTFWREEIGDTKSCSLCNQNLPLESFVISQDRVSADCKPCGALNALYYSINKSSDAELCGRIEEHFRQAKRLKLFIEARTIAGGRDGARLFAIKVKEEENYDGKQYEGD